MNTPSARPVRGPAGGEPGKSGIAESAWGGLKRAWFFQITLAVSLASLFIDPAAAQGIPEPSLVLYGVVRNTQDQDRLRIVFGNLTWQFQPTSGGSPFSVSASLTNINDQFSYVLRVPCETGVPGLVVSSNVLRMGSSYTRGNVLFNGTNPMTLVDPAQASFSLSSTSRGRLERVDLEISIVLEDSNGNGLPDAWEHLFFGRIGVDPLADPDGDGLDNLEEYKSGTNPNDFQSQFRFIRVTPQSQGVLLEWSSVANRSYSVLRSSDLLTGYEPLGGIRPATPPVNSVLDATAGAPGRHFYRVRLQE